MNDDNSVSNNENKYCTNNEIENETTSDDIPEVQNNKTRYSARGRAIKAPIRYMHLQFEDQTDYFGCWMENKTKTHNRTINKNNVMNCKSKDGLQTRKSKLNYKVPNNQDHMEQLKKLRGALQQSEKECSCQKNLNSELKRDLNFLNNELRERSNQIDNKNAEVEGTLDSNLNKNFDSTNQMCLLKDLLRLTNKALEQSKQIIKNKGERTFRRDRNQLEIKYDK